MVTTPQTNDLVLLLFPEQTDDPFVIGNVYADTVGTRAPVADTGEIRFNRDGASIDIIREGGERIIQLVDEDADGSSIATGLQINIDSGDIVMKNENGHGVEILSGGEVTIFGDQIDFDTKNEAAFK
jgi:hypothetical protein